MLFIKDERGESFYCFRHVFMPNVCVCVCMKEKCTFDPSALWVPAGSSVQRSASAASAVKEAAGSVPGGTIQAG